MCVRVCVVMPSLFYSAFCRGRIKTTNKASNISTYHWVFVPPSHDLLPQGLLLLAGY